MVEIQTPDHGTFEAANKWSDITLKQFEDLAQLEIPETLRDLWLARGRGDEKAYEEAERKMDTAKHMGENAEYFRKVMSILTDVPRSILAITEWDLVTEFYYEYLHQFVLSLFYQTPMTRGEEKMEPYTPPRIRQFTYRDTTYHLPKSLKIFGEEIPMAEEQVTAFAEAADMEIAFKDMEEKGVQKFAVICGIYCREKDRPYDQTESLRRAEAFRNLDMDTVWAVFFCILRLFGEYRKDIRKFLKNPEELTKRKRSRVASWKISTSEG